MVFVMPAPDLINTVFMGGSSHNPCITIYDLSQQHPIKHCQIQTVSSVYALDYNIDTNTLAAAAKDGCVYIVDCDQQKKIKEDTSKQSFSHGLPILSICWTSDTVLAISDIAGKCILRDSNSGEQQRQLAGTNSPICSLKKIDKNLLVGVSTAGELFFWDLLEGQLIEAVDINRPPPCSGLVHLLYHGKNNCLVIPATNGYLTIYNLNNGAADKLKVHTDDFYALAICDEMIITAGLNDCTLKVWEPEAKKRKPVSCHYLPEGVISIAVIGGRSDNIISIDKNGKAWLYCMENNSLRLLKPIDHQNYRTAFSPDAKQLDNSYKQKIETEVVEITNRIKNNLGNISGAENLSLYLRLEQLGYHHVSLALKSERAFQTGNILDGLKYSHQLTSLIQQDDPRCGKALEHYTGMLEKNWQFIEADEICSRIQYLIPGYQFTVDTERITTAAILIKTKKALIQPDITVEEIIQASSHIHSCFSGRYVIKSIDRYQYGRITINPHMILEKYESIREEEEFSDLPSAIVEHLSLITNSNIYEIDTVTFSGDLDSETEGLQLLLQISSNDHGTLLTPLIVFEFSPSKTNTPTTENNTDAFNALRRINSSALTNTYIDVVYKKAMFAVSRLFTENLSVRGRKI